MARMHAQSHHGFCRRSPRLGMQAQSHHATIDVKGKPKMLTLANPATCRVVAVECPVFEARYVIPRSIQRLALHQRGVAFSVAT